MPNVPNVSEPKDKKLVQKTGVIMVRAKLPGFYDRCRKKAGDVFTIRGEHELGFWMEIIENKE